MSTAPQGWQDPKVSWTPDDGVGVADRERIEGNINRIETANRTVDQNLAPSGNTGNLRQFLSWFANRIKAITGKANWYDTPSATIEGLNSRVSNIESGATLDARYVNASGDTMTGNLTIASATNAGIELGRTDGVSSTPFIDFHSGATATDYDSRIIASGGSGVTGGGSLNIAASAFTMNNNTIWHAGNDGSGSGLDADKLDGYHANTGTTASTIPVRDSSGNLPGNITGNANYATSAGNADTLDGYHGSWYVPPGAVMAFARSTPPDGWLECNGQAVSRTTYAALFGAIGTTFGAGNGSTTFNVPDLRGEFIRGWDHGRGVDPGRAFGSWQADEFKSHRHPSGVWMNGWGGSGGPYETGYGTDNTDQAITAATGGSETRPRNVALMYCIKY